MTRGRRVLLGAAVVLVLLVAGLAIAVRVLLGGDRIRMAIEAQATAALGRPVTIGAAAPQLFPRVSLDLTDIAIGAGREVTIERVRLSTGFQALLQRRVADAEVSIERSRIDVRWALALLEALVAGAPATPASAPAYALTIESVESIALGDVTLLAGRHAWLVDMESALTGDKFAVRRLDARSDHSSFRVEGEMGSVAARSGRFTLDAETLDLDELLAFFAAATPAASSQPTASGQAAPAPPRPVDFTVAVRSKQGRAMGAALANLSTTCRLQNANVVLDDLRLDVFGGRYAGRAAFLGSGAPRYEWRGTFENLDMPQVVAFAGSPGAMTGRLGGTVDIAAPGLDPLAAMRAARGSARIALTDGKITGLQIVRAVILAFGKPSGAPLPGSGETFSRIAATLAIADRRATTRDLTFASRDFDLTGAGWLSIPDQRLDIRSEVILSAELSAQAGRDLYRLARDGNRIVLPAHIGGTVSSPTVTLDIVSALQRAIRNKAEEQIKGLFDSLLKKRK
jgi:uncharacterized protein involved in outer membrane biogenesis